MYSASVLIIKSRMWDRGFPLKVVVDRGSLAIVIWFALMTRFILRVQKVLESLARLTRRQISIGVGISHHVTGHVTDQRPL